VLAECRNKIGTLSTGTPIPKGIGVRLVDCDGDIRMPKRADPHQDQCRVFSRSQWVGSMVGI
jgi:hypothetical protein